MNSTENKEPEKAVSEPNSPNMAASEDVKEIKEYTDYIVFAGRHKI